VFDLSNTPYGYSHGSDFMIIHPIKKGGLDKSSPYNMDNIGMINQVFIQNV